MRIYKLLPLEWVRHESGRLECGDLFRIEVYNPGYALFYGPPQDPYRNTFNTVDEAKAYAEALILEEALRWVKEVTPEDAS